MINPVCSIENHLMFTMFIASIKIKGSFNNSALIRSINKADDQLHVLVQNPSCTDLKNTRYQSNINHQIRLDYPHRLTYHTIPEPLHCSHSCRSALPLRTTNSALLPPLQRRRSVIYESRAKRDQFQLPICQALSNLIPKFHTLFKCWIT